MQGQQHQIGLWIDEQLWQALEDIDEEMSMKKAAITFNIFYYSLREWCYGVGNTRKKVSPTMLSLKEDELVKYLIQKCDYNYGISSIGLCVKVYEITQSRWIPFQNKIFGISWM